MRKSIAAAVIAASAATAACGNRSNEDAGPTVSRNYQVGNFHAIEVAGPYDVTVRTGGKPGVSARGSQKLLDHTEVAVEGDKLVIHPEKRGGLHIFTFGTRGSAAITVTVPQLSEATLAGSGNIEIDRVQGESFKGTIGGSGGLALDSVQVGALNLGIGGSGKASAASGKAQSANYSIGGSGDIEAAGVQAQQAKISIAGSGAIKANATGTADVSITGAGDVEVTGGAKCSISKSGSGNVHCS